MTPVQLNKYQAVMNQQLVKAIPLLKRELASC